MKLATTPAIIYMKKLRNIHTAMEAKADVVTLLNRMEKSIPRLIQRAT